MESTGVLNSPTSWFWNIRVGDKLQINGSGLWYTVVGPMVVTPRATINGIIESELFVNVGPGRARLAAYSDFQGPAANPVTVSARVPVPGQRARRQPERLDR